VTDQPRYTDQDWGLLVGLPQAVVGAASAAQPDGSRRTLAEYQAGHDAIAAGRESGNPLVQAVAAEVVARTGDPEQGEELPVVQPADPHAAMQDVLSRAARAREVLGAAADGADAAAYRHWLVGVAESVVGAAPTGGLLGFGGDQVTPAEQQFVAQLRTVLQD